ILEEPLAVPHDAPDVEFVVENADATFRIAVNRARTPQPTLRSGDTLSVQTLRDLLRRRASGVVPKNPPDDGSFVFVDFALTRRDDAVFEPPRDAIAVAETAARLADLDASSQPSARLVGQLLQEHRVH